MTTAKKVEEERIFADFTPKFGIDVTDWFKGEGLSKKQRMKKIEEELYDYSVFMQKAEYSALLEVEVKVYEE